MGLYFFLWGGLQSTESLGPKFSGKSVYVQHLYQEREEEEGPHKNGQVGNHWYSMRNLRNICAFIMSVFSEVCVQCRAIRDSHMIKYTRDRYTVRSCSRK